MQSTVLAPMRAILVLGVALAMAGYSIQTAQAAEHDDIAAVEAVIHDTAERWNSQDYSKVLELWDPDQEVPFYLAEEQDDWFIGWEPLRAYLDPPRPSPAVEGLREEMYDISVKLIADDLAIAAWRMHFELKMIGRKPIGEDVRVSAVLRKKPEGWRYVYWAESPMATLIYIEKLFQRDVDHEKFAPMLERKRAVRAAAGRARE